ncbi:hypothetical protein Tco_0453045 [Tanacetum coccineum]
MSGEIDEAQLKKVVDELLRQRCNSGEEHQYHVDQTRNYVKSDIVWERRKEILTLPTSKKKALVVYSCQRDLKAPPMTFHFLMMILKNELQDRTTYELGHEHKFIIEIIVRRANGKIDPFTELDYKYLNKKDTKDIYLLCINDKVKDYRETRLLGSLVFFIRATVIWERVHDFQLGMESYQQNVNLTAPTITFPRIEKEELFTITCEPVRVLEGLEKYNKDVKCGYVDLSPSDADDEYLRFYEEDIRECLKHRDQMRRWEMYVNGRPLRSRRDRLE